MAGASSAPGTHHLEIVLRGPVFDSHLTTSVLLLCVQPPSSALYQLLSTAFQLSSSLLQFTALVTVDTLQPLMQHLGLLNCRQTFPSQNSLGICHTVSLKRGHVVTGVLCQLKKRGALLFQLRHFAEVSFPGGAMELDLPLLLLHLLLQDMFGQLGRKTDTWSLCCYT